MNAPTTPDPNDELARKRAERERAQRLGRQRPVDDTPITTEQEAALERARESWALSHPKPNKTPKHDLADQD